MTDAPSKLTIRGARTHNLADITVALPRNRLSVVTGPSGSGKSSLVFHTIYAESQRRYIEALSSFARQFLDRLPRPDVDLIEGLSPAICVRQQVPGRSPRSTVGTATEVYDYLRLLYARVGQAFCPTCGREVRSFSPQQVAEEVLTQTAGQRFSVLAPLGSRNQQEIKSDLKRLRKEGFVRVLIDGCVRDLGRDVHLGASSRHELEVVIDRLSVSDGARRRLTEAVELAYAQSQGRCKVAFREGDSQIYSEGYACAEHGPVLPELSPRLFSFNDRLGACDACAGLGRRREFCIESVIPDESRSLAAGAVVPWGTPSGSFYKQMLKSMEASIKVNLDQPFNQLSADERALVLHGNPRFEGVLPGLHRRLRDYEQKKRREGAGEEEVFEYLEAELGQYSVWTECSVCHGSRLGVAAQSVRVQGMTIAAACRLSLRELLEFLGSLSLNGIRAQIAERIVRELADRLRFLEDVGVGYLSLDRSIASLSSGESQRVRLATQIGASFVGALYVLDEPSAGLHPRDMQRLWQTLLRLRDRGNTVLVVEHDETAIRAADHIVDMGPGAGSEGGRIVAQGVPKDVAASVGSPTGDFLAGRRSIAVPEQLRVAKEHIQIVSASTHNLREVNVRIPIGCLTCVTGVSGSGKSSLVMNTLVPAVRSVTSGKPLSSISDSVKGLESIKKIIEVTQDPIGRTPRSSPATFMGFFDQLRRLFASLPDAKQRGYKAGRFSFNVKGGRCEQCLGEGVVRVQMHFLPDVYVRCDTCGGSRYNRETLEVRYRGHSIADILALDALAARPIFERVPSLVRPLDALVSVGLGYLELGRSATTLSGGESQRLKLAKELGRKTNDPTLYVLDEPTAGLHLADVELLVGIVHQLVDAGHTVVVVEHHLEVIKNADWVIDLGPEAGDRGGTVICAGTPQEVAQHEGSHTGQFLRSRLRMQGS